MIRFYLDGGVSAANVDFYLLPSGMLLPNLDTQNITFCTNIVLVVDEVGVTPEQMDILRNFAKTQEVVIPFLPN
ncbi:hypothetical protein RRU01S_04_01390 [Agrobacterium rubi TR3 = NBRC 13261]|uniref:Uncharacterized protein n=1 Tax=Agrobacterium rubi TR3 = NBRC 13261 TaxID=1368415 RepID=A0A081CRM1_9HYPH|nr:hypothetical protein [Agrobacterium rubi]MBP1876874.1 hypothetical protein [Agrobacterium rubi]MCL6651064.1 hypothetical protein [Agrobacterium rubi]GAK69317.1 hypothetical protein RRU01S_04_01390 [Agrobacterium rubi TR3 = NBRC 13261]